MLIFKATLKSANLSGVQTIDESSTYFKIERLPYKMGMMGRSRFQRMLCKSIAGFVIKTYMVSNHIVFIYTKDVLMNKNFISILLEKISLLKKIAGHFIDSELWILRENFLFKCFGIIQNAPVFCKVFDDKDDVQQSLVSMIEYVESFSVLQGVRIFGFSSTEIDFGSKVVMEYSESFMQKQTEGLSIDEYCYKNFVTNKNDKLKLLMLAFLNIILTYSSGCLFLINRRIERSIQDLRSL